MTQAFLPAPLPHAQACFGTGQVPSVAAAAAILGPTASMHQVHGATLTYATEATQYPACDGLYTDLPNLWLAIKTADCTPCLISTPHAVAALHLGWRSAQAGLLPLTLQTLLQKYPLAPANIHISLGPALSQPHFEVEDTFPAAFGVPNTAPFFLPSKPGHVKMNLAAILTHQARNLGVPPENITSSHLCTFTEKDTFHSYRRDKTNPGRQISLIKRHP